MVATIKPYEIDPGIPITGEEGTPAPSVGDAVHFEMSDGKYYLANPLTRRNIIGMMDGDGNVIRFGPCGGLSGLTANAMYYLKWPTLSLGVETGVTTGDHFNVRKDVVDEFSHAQSFPGQSGKIIALVALPMYKYGTPSGFNGVHLALKEAGTGSKSTLARSETIPLADIPESWTSAAENHTHYRFFDPYPLDGAKQYMIGLCTDTNSVDPSYFLRVLGQASGNGYANGQRYYSSGAQYGIPEEWESWYNPADGSDLNMQIWWFDVDGLTPNISIAHPFEHADADVTCYHPIIKLGRASSTTVLDLNIERMETISFLESQTMDYLSAITNQFVYQPWGAVNTYGCERLLLLYKAHIDNTNHTSLIKPCWNFKVTGIGDSVNKRWANQRRFRTSIIHTVNGRGQLGFGFKQDNNYNTWVKGISLLGG